MKDCVCHKDGVLVDKGVGTEIYVTTLVVEEKGPLFLLHIHFTPVCVPNHICLPQNARGGG